MKRFEEVEYVAELALLSSDFLCTLGENGDLEKYLPFEVGRAF